MIFNENFYHKNITESIWKARISQDVQLSRSEHFKNFLTLKSFEFNAQKSEKLISKIGKNIKNGLIGTPVNIPTRWEDEQLYTERMNDRLTKIERINERIMTEMTSYKGKAFKGS